MGLLAAIGDRWRRSIEVRTVVSTVLVSTTVLAIAGIVLVSRITVGLEEAEQRQALSEAAAGHSIARAIPIEAFSQSRPERIAALMSDLSARAGQPPAFDVVLIPGSGSGLPHGSSALVDQSAVPFDLREVVTERDSQVWVTHDIEYADGRVEPGVIVGAPVTIPGVGDYQLFHLVPMTGVERSAQLVRSAVLGVGLALILALAGISWWSSRRLVRPLRDVADAADSLAGGESDRRVEVRGEDELARLGGAFNTMADSLVDQIERLQRLSEAQRRFVSDVSHELRTPLTTIRMAADVAGLRAPADDPDAVRSSELLRSEVDRFEVLLADLLEVSRFDAGAAVLDSEERDLNLLVSTEAQALSAVAQDRDVDLRIRLPADPTYLTVDPRRIRRILRNLFTNAIEYGAGRPVDVVVRADGVHEVVVSVRDHGRGVDPADRDRIFERFWRADVSRTRTLGGTGLGLAISREDARLHRGSLRVLEPDGEGAIFELRLPRVL